MAYFIYNAAPGPMFFLGNEIRAEAGRWTEVSDYSVSHGTFNSMRRMKFIYLVEADVQPTYDPTHPDNKARVEDSAPGAAASKKEKLADGSMNAEELQAFLAGKNATKVDKVVVTSLSGKTEAITAESLGDLGQSPIEGIAAQTAAEIQARVLGETTPFTKEAKAPKAPKAKKTETAAPPPENLGAWS